MNTRTLIPRLLTMVAIAVALAPTRLLACAVCMGASDSSIAPAMNAAIFLLLGFLGTMLTGVGGFALYLSRRSRLPHPPHEQFLDLSDNNAPDEED